MLSARLGQRFNVLCACFTSLHVFLLQQFLSRPKQIQLNLDTIITHFSILFFNK